MVQLFGMLCQMRKSDYSGQLVKRRIVWGPARQRGCWSARHVLEASEPRLSNSNDRPEPRSAVLIEAAQCEKPRLRFH